MPDPLDSLDRFATTHQAHGGQLHLVPRDAGGRAWIECSRCGARRIVAASRRGDGPHDDASLRWR